MVLSDGSAPTINKATEKCPFARVGKMRTVSFAARPAFSTSFLLARQQVAWEAYTVFLTSGFSSHTDRGPPIA